MILTCPACGTRYQMADDKFGTSPRTIRCARCKHDWVEYPVSAPMAPPPAPDANSEFVNTSHSKLPPLPPEAVSDDTSTFMAVALERPAHRAKQRLYLGLFALSFVVVGGVAALLMLQTPLLKMFPQLEQVYKPLGLMHEVSTPSYNGLAITGVTRELEDMNGMTSLVFRGQVHNQTTADMPVPNIEVKLFDERGVMLDYWKVQPDHNTLKPGATTGWACRFYNAPVDQIASFTTSFVD